ncbi:MAG: hypothetical protein U1E63_02945 [Burkholderiales bacterium]
MKKVLASEATRKRLEEVFSSEHIDPSRIVREATRLMIERALEAEVEQAVGRGYYAHGKGVEADGPRAPRNGVRRGRTDSAEGVIEFAAPQVRGLSGWSSEIRSALAGKRKNSRVWRWECMPEGFPCATSKRPSPTRPGAVPGRTAPARGV